MCTFVAVFLQKAKETKMKHTLFSIIMLTVSVLLPATAAAEVLPLLQNVNAYEQTSLNGEWNYVQQTSPEPEP